MTDTAIKPTESNLNTIKLYHGTGKVQALNIIKSGFVIPDISETWMLGRGAYFCFTPEAAEEFARQHKDGCILETVLIIREDKICQISECFAIGLCEHRWLDKEQDWSDYEECLAEYVKLAKLVQADFLTSGYSLVRSNHHVVIVDEDLLKELRFKIIK